MVRVFLVTMLCGLTTACAGENEQMAAREAELLRDVGVQELIAEIEGAKEIAMSSLEVVHDWVQSEANALFEHGSQNPVLELANSARLMRTVADNLDPNGPNREAIPYVWIRPTTQGLSSRSWYPFWEGLSAEAGSTLDYYQDEIRKTPLHPYSALGDASRMDTDKPMLMLEALEEADEWSDRMMRVVGCHQREPWACGSLIQQRTADPDVLSMEGLKAIALVFGGLDTLSPERMANNEKAARAINDVWDQWQVANDAAAELQERVEALEILRH